MQNDSSSSKPNSRPRDRQRFEKKREQMSMKTDSENKKILFEKLFFGFKTQSEAMHSMQIVKIPRSVIIPISTRGIGFMNRYLMQRLSRLNIQNVNFHELSASLYRVSLCMLDIKVMQVMQNHVSRNLGVGFANTFISVDFVRAIGSLGSGFSPLLNLVSSVGILKAYGTTILPRIPSPLYHHGFPTWDATLVSFSDLRDYVNALSNPATPQVIRQQFYDHNPIPCAIWTTRPRVGVRNVEGDAPAVNDWPLLTNPDHIMPPDYGLADMHNDVDVIMTSLEAIGRKYPKYVFTGRVEYDGPGLASQLVSNTVSDVRCSDLQAVPNYSFPPLTGNISSFWTNETMSDPEFYMGMLHLLGEIPSTPDSRWSMRNFESSKESADSDYISTLANMIG